MTQESTERTLTVALLSDIHAYAKGRDDGPSHIETEMPEDDPASHPVVGLERLIREQHLSADVLLCGGDLCDRADEAGVAYAWKLVGRLGERLESEHVIATAGNHDLDSRYQSNKYSPKEVLQALRPRFPLIDDKKYDQYWSRHYAIVEGVGYRIVTLNSCAFHGQGPEEAFHGRVTRATLVELEEELRQVDHPPPVNILLCHHHPVQFADIGDDDYDSIDGGAPLLELLRSGELGRWMVIHGHRHLPHLTYALGGGAAPVIFSAASFSVDLHRVAQARARNQFYMLDFPIGETQRLGLSFAGRFRSWYWVPRRGWEPTPSDVALPAEGGFGFRQDGREVAARIHAHMLDERRSIMTWADIVSLFPKLAYLIPEDIALTRLELTRLGVGLLPRNGSTLEQVEIS